MAGRAMTAAQVAEELTYLTRTGDWNTRLVFRLAREAIDGLRRFPEPIDASLDARLWRWSRAQVESYAAGEWSTDNDAPTPLRGAA